MVAPSPRSRYPPEIEDAHATDAVPANAEFVTRAFGAEVRVANGVSVDAKRSERVFVGAGKPCRDWRRADEVERAVRRFPKDHRRLDTWTAVDDDEVLRR